MVKKIGPSWQAGYAECGLDIRNALDEGGLPKVIQWIVDNSPVSARAEVTAWAARHGADSAVGQDDVLNALTGILESRLLFRVPTADNQEYHTAEVVLWRVSDAESEQYAHHDGLQVLIHVDHKFVGSSTTYGLNLTDLSRAADKLAEGVTERLRALGYSVQ